MNSPTPPDSTQQDREGRSVRDVVAYSAGEVDDAWCRKVLRKILKSLELQYAMQMPHRAITLDTIVFHANGEPLLISDDIDAAPAPDAHLADDLTALAGVIHYAITHELAPSAPLLGRVDGYSAAVIATVDACMDPDPALRPQSVDAVSGMLALEPTLPSATATTSVSLPVVTPPQTEYASAGMRRGQRWAIAAGGCAIAIALALVIFPSWRDAGSNNRVVTTQPGLPAPNGAAPVHTVPVDARADQAAANPANDPAGSTGASSGGTTSSSGEAGPRADMPRVARSPARADAPAAAPPVAVASYQLQIKPWGVVYVDGVERGLSPPLKRLALTPGPHTIRIANPQYRDSILEFESAQTTSNGKIIIDFTEETH